MKIVLDTNCLVNVIMPGSYNNDIWQAFRASKYVLCVTNEYCSNITRSWPSATTISSQTPC